MDYYYREPPATQEELLVYQVMYKTNRDALWSIIHRWLKQYPINDQKYKYYLELLMYIKNN